MEYLKNNQLDIELLGKGFTWLDTGTHDSLLEASNFVKTIEKRSGYKVSCLEEIALKNKWINKKNIAKAMKFYGKCEYSQYLSSFMRKN